MKTRHYLLTVILSIIFLPSCSDDEESSTNNNQVVVRFTSSISGQIKKTQTKMAGSSWDMGDEIGIFAKKSGQNLSSQSIIDVYDNVKYTTVSGSGNFLAAKDMPTICFPEDGTSVDFIAYYPYQPSLNNFVYEVDVFNQTPQEAIDLIYSDNSKGQSQTNPSSALSFTHQLTKLELNITAGNGIPSLSGLTVNLVGFTTKADFDLVNGEMIIDQTSVKNFAAHGTVKSATSILAEALVLPSEAIAGRKILFTLSDGKTYTYDIPSANQLKKGLKYTYNITLKGNGTVVEPEYGPIETPLIDGSLANMQYVVHNWPTASHVNGLTTQRNYSIFYDTKYKMSYWVAHPLYKSIIKTGNRTDAWGPDPEILTSLQPIVKDSWANKTYQRGHLLPSADRNLDKIVNRTTFYYTNQVPQNGSMNTGVWSLLEEKIRAWTKSSDCDTMYIVTGAMIKTVPIQIPINDSQITYTQDNSGKNVAVPKYMFKVLAKRKGDVFTTIAYKINNEKVSGGYGDYKLTVKDLEQETGFTFFPTISDDIKSKIEANKWN